MCGCASSQASSSSHCKIKSHITYIMIYQPISFPIHANVRIIRTCLTWSLPLLDTHASNSTRLALKFYHFTRSYRRFSLAVRYLEKAAFITEETEIVETICDDTDEAVDSSISTQCTSSRSGRLKERLVENTKLMIKI